MTKQNTPSCTHPEWQELSYPILLELLCGNEDAARFYIDVARASHTYDDLIDADASVDAEAIHTMVWRLLFSIPLNAFFAAHQNILRPILMTGILNWVAANDMESTGITEELRVAHVVRFSVSDILLASMVLVGGVEHARKNARKARLLMQDETWIHYATEQGVSHENL